MHKSRAPALRDLLRGSMSEGATARQLAEALGLPPKDADSVFHTLRHMPDTYIDRWDTPANAPLTAVWCVVVPPPDTPKPERPKK
jgi:hypothetical protein